MTHTCNIGIRPLGRGAEPSPIIAAEIKAHKAYVRAMMALPVVTSNEIAHAHRVVAARHKPALIPIFEELGLSY